MSRRGFNNIAIIVAIGFVILVLAAIILAANGGKNLIKPNGAGGNLPGGDNPSNTPAGCTCGVCQVCNNDKTCSPAPEGSSCTIPQGQLFENQQGTCYKNRGCILAVRSASTGPRTTGGGGGPGGAGDTTPPIIIDSICTENDLSNCLVYGQLGCVGCNAEGKCTVSTGTPITQTTSCWTCSAEVTGDVSKMVCKDKPTVTPTPDPSAGPSQSASPAKTTIPTATVTVSPAKTTSPGQTPSPAKTTSPSQSASPAKTTSPSQTASTAPSNVPSQTASTTPSTAPSNVPSQTASTTYCVAKLIPEICEANNILKGVWTLGYCIQDKDGNLIYPYCYGIQPPISPTPVATVTVSPAKTTSPGQTPSPGSTIA